MPLVFQKYWYGLKLKKSKIVEHCVQFQCMVANDPHQCYDCPKFRSIRRAMGERDTAGEEEWVSWKEIVEQHGETIAQAALRLNAVPNRPHTLRTTSYNVPWPDSH